MSPQDHDRQSVRIGYALSEKAMLLDPPNGTFVDFSRWIVRIGRRGHQRRTTATIKVRNAQELWEKLAVQGAIPESWVENPYRRFGRWCPHCCNIGSVHGIPAASLVSIGLCSKCEQRGWTTSSYPHDLSDVLPLALDPRGVETAEALAFDLAHHRGWRCSRCCWLTLPLDQLLKQVIGRGSVAPEINKLGWYTMVDRSDDLLVMLIGELSTFPSSPHLRR